MEEKRNFKSSMMTGSKLAIYQVESFLEESYLFRRNVLNGKTEFFCIKPLIGSPMMRWLASRNSTSPSSRWMIWRR